MNQVSVDIKDMIEGDSSLSLVFKTDLFVNFEPDKPDDCVTIYAFDEAPPTANLDPTNKKLHNPKVQVRVRNNSSITGWNLINSIKNVLNDKYNEKVNDTNYRGVFVTSGPIPLGQDENNRFIYTINFDVQRDNA